MKGAALVAAAFVLGGCAGGGEADAGAGSPRAAATSPAVSEARDAAPARVLVRFVRAIRAGDESLTWQLLSAATRGGYGGTLASFRRGGFPELSRLFETFRTERVLLSRRIGLRWAVAALGGTRTTAGETDPFAYAAAMVRERGAWRLELGGAVIGGLQPEPAQEVEARPKLEAEVGVAERLRLFGLWLDGRRLSVRRDGRGVFRASFRARAERRLAPGRHDAVAFVATDTAAAAVAWPFSVAP